MAKAKAKVNKSEEVRQLLRDDPNISTEGIIKALADKGIAIKAGSIYTIKTKMKKEKGVRGRPKAKPAMAATTKQPRQASANSPAEAVTKVKSLASQLGGLKNLKNLVDALVQ